MTQHQILRGPHVTFGPRRKVTGCVNIIRDEVEVSVNQVWFIVDVLIDGTIIGELRKQIGTMVLADDGSGNEVLDKTDAMVGYIPSKVVAELFQWDKAENMVDTLAEAQHYILETARSMHWEVVDWISVGTHQPAQVPVGDPGQNVPSAAALAPMRDRLEAGEGRRYARTDSAAATRGPGGRPADRRGAAAPGRIAA